MRKILLFLLLIQLAACSKDKVDFILEKSFGSGSAYDAEIAADSTYLIAGESDGAPLFIKTGSGSNIDISYSPDAAGLFTEVLEYEGGYLLAGCKEGDLMLYCIDKEGVELWDTTIAVTPYVQTTQICHFEDDSYMLVASDHPDSLNSSLFVIALFDINGDILQLNEASPGFNPSLTDLLVLSPQEIYASLTKNYFNDNSKASVVRLTDEGGIVWETELYNNRDYMARSLAIEAEGGNLYIAGSTQYTGGDGDVINSFVASLTLAGTVSWKEYLEAGNSGSDIDFDSGMNLVLLNQNCMILSGITLPDASSTQKIRVLEACDSYDTEMLGRSLSLTYEDDFLIAGSKDAKFYYALKSGLSE